MHRIHINIGSNQGDRKALIGRAVALLVRAFSPARLRLSSYIESEPWGYSSPNPFLNLGVMIDIDHEIHPEQALSLALAVEKEVGKGTPHRNPDGTYCDRPIDIDLITFDNIEYNSPTLTLPHPRATQRPFVLTPLKELEPENHILKS